MTDEKYWDESTASTQQPTHVSVTIMSNLLVSQ